MKVLILGGTGAMGKDLVKIVSQYAQQVVVTSRSRGSKESNIEFRQGNAKELSFLNKLLTEHWDVIVDFMVYKTNEFEARYNQLLDATDHYIYLSSARVYADSVAPIKESSPRLLDVINDTNYLASDEYALSKARQENILFDSPKKNWTIIRPYITYNDERLQLGVLEKESWLYSALKGRPIVFCKDIYDKHTTLTSGKDVAQGISSLLGKPQAHGEAFHITADMPISWQEVSDTYLDVLESHLPRRTQLSLQELENFLKWRTNKYQIIYDRLYNRRFDNNKINQFIDTSKFIDARTGLTECLNTFITLKPNQFKVIDWKEEAIKNKLEKTNVSPTEFLSFKQAVKYYVYRYSNFSK